MNEKNLSRVRRLTDFDQMIQNGVAIVDDIEAGAKRLAEKMERIHGEKYRAFIDHEVGLVVVREV